LGTPLFFAYLFYPKKIAEIAGYGLLMALVVSRSLISPQNDVSGTA